MVFNDTSMEDPGTDTRVLYTIENGRILPGLRLSSPGQILRSHRYPPMNRNSPLLR